MQLYKVIWEDIDQGPCFSFHATERTAEAKVTRIQNKYNADHITKPAILTMHVPADKAEFVAWLNKQFLQNNNW